MMNKNCLALMMMALAGAGAQADWPELIPVEVSQGTLVLTDKTNVDGDVVAEVAVSGTEALMIYGVDTSFSGDVWVKVNVDPARDRQVDLFGIAHGSSQARKRLDGDMNLMLSGWTYEGGESTYIMGTHTTVGGDINLTLNDSNVRPFRVMGSQSVLEGSFSAEINGGNFSEFMIVGTSIGGDYNVVYNNIAGFSNAGVQTFYIASTDFSIGGDLNVTLNGGTIDKTFRAGGSAGDPGNYRIAGDVNVVIGGYRDESGQYVASQNETVLGSALGSVSDPAFLVTGAYVSAEGDINVTFVGGTVNGAVAMGPNSAVLGKQDGSTVTGGNINLSFLDGTYNGKIYAGSYYKSSNGSVLGDVHLSVSGGQFNDDIYVGAFSDSYLKGRATATFGDLANVTFADGTSIHGAKAVQGTAITFNGSRGTFGANIRDFDNMVFSANSDVFLRNASGITAQARTVVFYENSLTDGAKMRIENGVVDFETIEVILDKTFTANVGDYLGLIFATGDFDMEDVLNVTLKYADGSDYLDLIWRAIQNEQGFGIEFVAIPESASAALLLAGCAGLMAVVRRRRK